MRLKLFLFMIVLSMILVACQSEDEPAEEEDEVDQLEEEENDNSPEEEENDDPSGGEEDRDSSKEEEDGDSSEEEEGGDSSEEKDGDSTEEGEGTRIEFQEIAVTIPEGVTELEYEEAELPIISYSLDDITGANFNIVAEPLPPELELTVDGYIELVIENLHLEYNELNSFEMNGVEWAEILTDEEGFPVRNSIFVHNDTAYILSLGTATQAEFEEWIPVIDEVIESVEIIE